MSDELRDQIEPIHQIVRAMGLPLLIVDYVEADDVIGTLAAQAKKQEIDVVISTGDKDMAQLVNGRVTLINTMSNELLDSQGVEEKYGVKPRYIVDYLALMGDKSDNIPGVPKVGEKTAVGLVSGLGSVEDIYANLDKVATLSFRGAKTLAPRLEEHKEQAFLSKELATIKCDVELEFALEDLKSSQQDTEQLKDIFTELEFRAWVTELGGSIPAAAKAKGTTKESAEPAPVEPVKETAPKPEVKYDIIFDQKTLDAWLEKIKQK